MMKKALRNGLILAIVAMLLFFKAIDVANGWTAESPSYPITHASTGRR